VPGDAGADIALHVAVQGVGPPLIMLHGFTGSAETLEAMASSLQRDFTVYRVDLVGHGRSAAPADAACYTMDSCLAQLCALLDSLDIARAHWLGYSMGARVVLSLCAAHPERVCSALLIGASPGIAEPELRAERVAADAALARRLRDRGIGDFVDYWMALPLFASQRRLGAAYWQRQRGLRLANRAEALAASLTGMGCGAMAPLHSALPAITCPVCLVVGAEDEKFLGIAQAMAARLPRAQVAVVAGAGHAAHLEQAQACTDVIRAFFNSPSACAE